MIRVSKKLVKKAKYGCTVVVGLVFLLAPSFMFKDILPSLTKGGIANADVPAPVGGFQPDGACEGTGPMGEGGAAAGDGGDGCSSSSSGSDGGTGDGSGGGSW